MKTLSFCAALLALAASLSAETAYFVCAGPANWIDGQVMSWRTPESFVVPVSNAAQIDELRQFLAARSAGQEPRPMVLSVALALGADGVNRNYAEPGRPLWGWHVTKLLSYARTQGNAIDASYQLWRDGDPSIMEAFLRGTAPYSGTYTDHVALLYYPLQMELRPGAEPQFANVSCRGYIAAAEPQLITGFVIQGGTPRNVIIRVLGPSLAAFGVASPLADPRFALYRGNTLVATNDTWTDSSLNGGRTSGQVMPLSPLAPTSTAEPALRLTLEPGNYTVVARGAGTSTGTVLAEVYNLDP